MQFGKPCPKITRDNSHNQIFKRKKTSIDIILQNTSQKLKINTTNEESATRAMLESNEMFHD
jgi:hypothetical protein